MNHSTDKPAPGHLFSDPDYGQWLLAVKQGIHAVRMRIALSANSELIAFYYEIGAQIVDREAHAHWGCGFIDALSKDLRASFPDIGGFSSKNLRYCRAFFRFYCAPEIWQQVVAKLDVTPWATCSTVVSATSCPAAPPFRYR